MFENKKVDTITLHRQRHLIIMGHILITNKGLLAVTLKLTVSFRIYQMYHNRSYQNEQNTMCILLRDIISKHVNFYLLKICEITWSNTLKKYDL